MEELMRKYGNNNYKIATDKAIGHTYGAAYEQILAPYKNVPIRLLEIGICSGASLLCWREYFPHGEIIGVDIDVKQILYPLPNITTIEVDATKEESLDIIQGNFDIIIDDGSHEPMHQLATLNLYHSRLNKGGLMIIEDVSTAMDMLATRGYELGLEVLVYDNRNNYAPDDALVIFRKT
jgi:predicted O-methyltransferase YrrM